MPNHFDQNSVDPVESILMDVDVPLVDLDEITVEHSDLGNNFPPFPAHQGNSVESALEIEVTNVTAAHVNMAPEDVNGNAENIPPTNVFQPVNVRIQANTTNGKLRRFMHSHHFLT